MSFQAYIANVEKATGKSIDEICKLAIAKGLITETHELAAGKKAGDIINWLKEDFELGHGHAMSVVAYFKGKRE